MYSSHSAECSVGVKVSRLDLRGLSAAWVLCAAQAITTALAVVIVWTIADSAAAIAALFGGIVVVVPALYFAFRVDRRRGATQAKEVLGAFYRAEAGKLLLTALLFFIGVRLFGDRFAPLMLTSVACLAMNWLVLAFVTVD
jgi:ATP synthase protein I